MNSCVSCTNQGSTSIPAGDLPDDIREMLAYGDPLNITAMNQTDASLKSPVIRRAPSPAPAAAPVPQPAKKKVVVEDLDPPAGKPKIETPTHTGDSGSSSSGNMWVPPPILRFPPCNNDIPAMKTIIHPLAAILLAWSAGASETWSTSPAEAMQQAAAQNKGVMLEFTGSDWCGACIMQKKQALSLPEIQTAISRSFIPVELDYPRKKQQDAQTKTSLETYKKSYGITGFPRWCLRMPRGGRPHRRRLRQSCPGHAGYKKAAEALNTQQSLTNNLAEKLTDQQRRDTLVQLLKTVPQSSIRTFYKPALAELEKLDPQDASGILAKLHRDDLLHAQKLEWADTFRKKNIHILADQNPDEALSIMDSYLKKNGLLPEVKQAVLMQKVYLLMQQNRVNELEQPLKEGVALLPKSFEGKAFSKLLDKLPEIKKERGLLKPGGRAPPSPRRHPGHEDDRSHGSRKIIHPFLYCRGHPCPAGARMDLSADHILVVFLLTTLAGLATGIGGFIAFFMKRTDTKTLTFALGLSGGVMVYISLVELLGEAQHRLIEFEGHTAGSWIAIASFFGGIAVAALIDYLVPEDENPHEARGPEDIHGQASGEFSSSRIKRSGILFALAIGIHNFPEGIATFAAGLDSLTLGTSIALAVAVHNIPEGIAVAVPLYYGTGSRKKALFYSFLSGLAEPVGAAIAMFFLFHFLTPTVLAVLFASVAGIMVFISFDELLPMAERWGHHHISIMGIIAGMLLMAIVLI